MTTADRIRNRRLELGLTQQEVAQRLGLTSKAAVCKVEKQGDDVTLKYIEKFAKALDCSPLYLMGWITESQNKELEREQQFVALYSRLDEKQRKLIDNMLETLTSAQ